VAWGSWISCPSRRPESTWVLSSPTRPGWNWVCTGLPSGPGVLTNVRPPWRMIAELGTTSTLSSELTSTSGLRGQAAAQPGVAVGEQDGGVVVGDTGDVQPPPGATDSTVAVVVPGPGSRRRSPAPSGSGATLAASDSSNGNDHLVGVDVVQHDERVTSPAGSPTTPSKPRTGRWWRPHQPRGYRVGTRSQCRGATAGAQPLTNLNR